MGQGNQHGGREYDDLQNGLDMASHENPLEGLHDAVRTYTRMTLPRSLVSFLYVGVWRKTT